MSDSTMLGAEGDMAQFYLAVLHVVALELGGVTVQHAP